INPDGKLDQGFGHEGRSTFGSPVDGMATIAASLIPLGDGRFIVHGFGYDPSDNDSNAVIVARGNADGSADPNYPLDEYGGSYIFGDDAGNGEVELLPHGYLSTSQDALFETNEDRYGTLVTPNGHTFFGGVNLNGTSDQRGLVDRILPVPN